MAFKVGDWVIVNDPDYYPEDVGKIGVVEHITGDGLCFVRFNEGSFDEGLYYFNELSHVKHEQFKQMLKDIYGEM